MMARISADRISKAMKSLSIWAISVTMVTSPDVEAISGTARGWAARSSESAFSPCSEGSDFLPTAMSSENSSTMMPPPIWKAGRDTRKTCRMASPNKANTKQTMVAIRTERAASCRTNAVDAPAVSVAQTMVTRSGPIVVSSSRMTS